MSFTSSGRTLTVGSGKQFMTLHDAISASQSGDTIRVLAGVYENDCSVITHDLRIVGIGGLAHLKATAPVDNEKGILDVENGANVIIKNMEFSGATVPDENGAGIRHHGGDLIVWNSVFHNNENGILAGDNPAARVVIRHSEFAENGNGDGYTHGVYVNHIDRLVVADSYFHDTMGGHHIKSRAMVTDVETSRLIDGDGTTSYSIDMPNGGRGIVKDNYIEQDAQGENSTLISYAGEGDDNGGHLLVRHNQIVNHLDGCAYAVRNWSGSTADIIDNTFESIDMIATGPNHQHGNSIVTAADTATGDWMFG